MRVSGGWPALVEPGQIGGGSLSRLPLAFEERVGLGQDQCVRAARTQGLVSMNVTLALLPIRGRPS